MSDSNDLKPLGPPSTPVPDLIEQYRVRRDAWIAQADELARLRDEVRGSAEREAMEIVTAARRDVRQIVMEARRELLVLSAQVQAALGEAGARPDPTLLLNRARDIDDESTEEFPDAVFAPEEAVKGMLEEARADMDALAEDARTVPFQALQDAPAIPAPPPAFPPTMPQVSFTEIPAPPIERTIFVERPLPAEMPEPPPPSNVLLSSPFPSDAVPVPSGGRARMFVGFFALAGIGVLAGTIWWLRSPDTSETPSSPPARAEAAPPANAPASTPSSPTPAAPSDVAVRAADAAASANLTVVLEARRSSWLQTTVDGQTDGGRTIQQGETIRLSAQKGISVRVGDAGALMVSVNKGPAVALGRDGQVVTRQFVVEATPRSEAPPPGQPAPATPAKPAPLSGPVASGPAPGPPLGQPPVPLVQPVAAAPNPPLDPGPVASPPRETVPPPAPRAELPQPAPSSPASAVITASRQWLDAYHRQDRNAMASLSTDGLQLADERRNEERFPANMEVSRSLDRVSVQIAADTAVLTAVMTERATDNAVPPRVSPISQVWVLTGNQWRVRQVRLVSEARLNQIFR